MHYHDPPPNVKGYRSLRLVLCFCAMGSPKRCWLLATLAAVAPGQQLQRLSGLNLKPYTLGCSVLALVLRFKTCVSKPLKDLESELHQGFLAAPLLRACFIVRTRMIQQLKAKVTSNWHYGLFPKALNHVVFGFEPPRIRHHFKPQTRAALVRTLVSLDLIMFQLAEHASIGICLDMPDS